MAAQHRMIEEKTMHIQHGQAHGPAFSKVLACVLVSILISGNSAVAAKAQEQEPDYTKGEKLEGRSANSNLNYASLGPIGAIGNVWAHRGAKPTDQTRMIQIRSVMENTPGHGILKEGDVILGVISPTREGSADPNARFDSDARKALAAAITEAEKRANAGQLTLNIWRAGRTQAVTITLPIRGRFSETSPWQCAKTNALIDAACADILARGLYNTKRDGSRVIKGGIPTRLEVLGLLATGEAKYLPVIRDYVHELADSKKDMGESFHTWSISYEMLLLTEYYLATKDDYVLPTIQKAALTIARGASDVGTFSHGSAYHFEAHGKQWKYPSAYGAMNQCSITCAMALVLARKCGVDDPEVDRVIQLAANFYRWFVDKGSIPYGDHAPGSNHDNNGVNSQAAVLFDLLGDQAATEYYTRNTLASYHIREQGHTGHFFSFQWGALGAARGGDQAAQSFIRNTRWFTELERRPTGGFMYQPQLASADHGKYINWSSTGSRLMQMCLPRKKLYITGKGGSCMAPLTGEKLASIVAVGEFDPKARSVEQLLEALGSWSPIMRRMASEELGERDQDVVDELIAMLDSSNRYARYGACEGLSYAGRGSADAIDALVAKLEGSDDLTLRYYAATAFRKKRIWQPPPIRAWKTLPNTLAREGGAIDRAIPALLKQAATYEPDQDPGRKLHAVIASTLFYGGSVQNFTGFFPSGQGIEQVDRALLIPAVKSVLQNPNGGARSTVSSVFARLTEGDLTQLWGDIYYATKYQAPSGSMFAGGVRGNGLALMAKKGVKEGITLGIDWALRQEGWGNGGRKKSGIPTLLSYGRALKDYVPEIEKVLAGWTGRPKSKNKPEAAVAFKQQLDDALKKPAPELKSIQSYIDVTPDPLADAEAKR